MDEILARARQAVKPIITKEAANEIVSDDLLNFRMKAASARTTKLSDHTLLLSRLRMFRCSRWEAPSMLHIPDRRGSSLIAGPRCRSNTLARLSWGDRLQDGRHRATLHRSRLHARQRRVLRAQPALVS